MMMPTIEELTASNAALVFALERLIADNEKRGLTSGNLSWARLMIQKHGQEGMSMLAELATHRHSAARESQYQRPGMIHADD